jgi:hypothetical protein
MRARVQVVLARKLLEQAVPVLGAGSDEGKKILKALTNIADIYQGAPAGGIQQAEMKSLASQAPAGPQPTPAPMGGMGMGGPTPGPGTMG